MAGCGDTIGVRVYDADNYKDVGEMVKKIPQYNETIEKCVKASDSEINFESKVCALYGTAEEVFAAGNVKLLGMLDNFDALATSSYKNKAAIGSALRYYSDVNVAKEKKVGWVRTAVFTAVAVGLTSLCFKGCEQPAVQKNLSAQHKLK